MLRKFPRIRTLLDEVVARSRRRRLAQRSARQEEYLAKIEAATQLSASPEPLTQKALCRGAGIPLSCLYSSPLLQAKAKDVVLASSKTDQLHRTRQSQPRHFLSRVSAGDDRKEPSHV